jgi:ATP-dependent DNA helicase DinG
MSIQSIEEIFATGGYLARASDRYERRDGQVALADAIHRAIADGAHLLAEGPCGTGKSVAYLAPSIRHAAEHGRRIVVATATNALSEQLVTKDLPMLANALPWEFTFALLKGRANYACLERVDAYASPEELRADGHELDRVREWARGSATGDLRELTFQPSKRVLDRITVGPDACPRRECDSYARCFYERAKAEALAADIIVTNYHVLFASIELLKLTGEHCLLPPFDVVVLDEAHEAADVAREFFGWSLGARAFDTLAGHALDVGKPVLADALQRQGREFLEEVRRQCPPGRHRGGLDLNVAPLLVTLEEVKRWVGQTAAQVATRAAQRIQNWIGAEDPDQVYWLETSDRGYTSLRACPIEVGPVLRAELFQAAKSVIAVSATLTVNGTFAFARAEMGAPEDARELEVPSPFDFQTQARLVVPRALPDPRDASFTSASADMLERVVEQCNGRTLALFTSYKALDAAHARLARTFEGRYRILRQGESPRAELIRTFREDVHSVLLATQSFWTGIDIPGEALTGLVIDRLPFPPPNDPVGLALAERLPNAFSAYTVPKAALLLKQGVGRLIRTRDDVGVIVLLDNRLLTKSYGRQMLRTLPPMPVAHDLGGVAAFLAKQGRAA